MVEVCLPGTGGMIPLEYRWLTCCWIEHQGKAILIDCGEGTQVALKKCGCKLGRLDTLLITHFHADHIAGLPGLLLTLGNYGKTTPLTIMGPGGLKEIVSALTVIAPMLPFVLEICELNECTQIVERDEMEISTLLLSHGIPCLGYCISIKRKPIFNPQKADQLGIPKPLYKKLHVGEWVQLNNGQIIKPEMVIDGEREPIRVCYCTDTYPIDAIADFARGADLFICEGMYGDDKQHAKMEEKGHMVYSDSAKIAQAANVKKLWLTHYSPAMQNPEEYIENVRDIFHETVAAYDGIRTTLGKR